MLSLNVGGEMERFLHYLKNPHTRRIYRRAVEDFLEHCQATGLRKITSVRPMHVSDWMDWIARSKKPTSVVQEVAAVRTFFDFLLLEGVVTANPAITLRGLRVLAGRRQKVSA